MIGKETSNERPVTLAEVLEILEKVKKRGELGHEQRLAYDHAQKFSSLNANRARELTEKLVEELGLKREQAVALVDLIPETRADVELIFAKERKKLEEREIDRVLELINEYRR